MQGKPDLVDRAAVYIRPEIFHIAKDIYIGQRLAGIEKNGIGLLKCMLQLLVLFLDHFGMIDVKRCAEFFCDGDQAGRGKGIRHAREYTSALLFFIETFRRIVIEQFSFFTDHQGRIDFRRCVGNQGSRIQPFGVDIPELGKI